MHWLRLIIMREKMMGNKLFNIGGSPLTFVVTLIIVFIIFMFQS